MEKKSRELLAPHVEEELMDYILHTPVKIGEKLPNEFELAELFGVGRSTVREKAWFPMVCLRIAGVPGLM